MSDEQIVRTLAEFMGLVKPDELYRVQAYNTSPTKTWVILPPSGHGSDEILEYLTSYDALAPVWRKLSNRPLSVAYGKIFAEGPWFEVSPRGHAETIALAIQEANG